MRVIFIVVFVSFANVLTSALALSPQTACIKNNEEFFNNSGEKVARLYQYSKRVLDSKTGQETAIQIKALIYNPNKVKLSIPAKIKLAGKMKLDRITGTFIAETETGTLFGRKQVQERLLSHREEIIEKTFLNPFYASGNENVGFDAKTIYWNNGQMLYAKEEPIGQSVYTCLSLFKNDRIQIHKLKFRFEAEKWKPLTEEGMELTDLVTAISIKPLLLKSKELSPKERLPAFCDLRHVFQFPFLNPALVSKLGINTEALTSGALFFGLDKLTVNSDLAEQALDHPIDLPKNLITYDKSGEKKIIEISDDILVEILSTDGYRKQDQITQPGDFKINKNSISCWLRQAPYPHHVIGLNQHGQVVELFIEGKSGFTGLTLDELVKEMKQHGIIDGGSVDQGGGVYLWLKGKELIKPSFPTATSLIVGTLIEDLEASL